MVERPSTEKCLKTTSRFCDGYQSRRYTYQTCLGEIIFQGLARLKRVQTLKSSHDKQKISLYIFIWMSVCIRLIDSKTTWAIFTSVISKIFRVVRRRSYWNPTPYWKPYSKIQLLGIHREKNLIIFSWSVSYLGNADEIKKKTVMNHCGAINPVLRGYLYGNKWKQVKPSAMFVYAPDNKIANVVEHWN